MATVLSSPLLSREEAAEYLGICSQTLAVWATTGRYKLPFAKIGSRAMYRRQDLDAFIAGRTVTSTGELDD